jgi:hypothetical protein
VRERDRERKKKKNIENKRKCVCERGTEILEREIEMDYNIK